jgi:hypothetical protein
MAMSSGSAFMRRWYNAARTETTDVSVVGRAARLLTRPDRSRRISLFREAGARPLHERDQLPTTPGGQNLSRPPYRIGTAACAEVSDSMTHLMPLHHLFFTQRPARARALKRRWLRATMHGAIMSPKRKTSSDLTSTSVIVHA